MKTAELIALILTIIDAASKGIAIALAGRAKLQQIAAEDREPTPEEIAELRAITTKLHEQIQAG